MFHWYGLIVGVAIVAGWSVAERVEPKVNKVLPWVLIFGLIGARLYHVIDEWSYYSQNLGQIPAVWNGGLGIFGGIVGGIIGLQIYQYTNVPKNQRKTEFWRVLGAMVVGLPLAQAIGRWGNLVNDELWGRGRAPLFLYESVLDLLLFIILWRAHKRHTAASLVGIYLLGYGMIRLALEPMKIGAWWVGYAMSAIFVGTGVVLWLDQRRAQ